MTSLPLRVLVADPSDSSAERILRALAEGGFAVSSARVNSSEAVRVALAEGEWRLVVLCTHLPEFSTAVLADLRAGNPDLPFLVVVAPQHHELAAQLTQCSLDDCLVSEHLPLLCSRVRRLLDVARLRRDLRAAEASRDRERAIGARFRTLVEKSHNACVVLDREGTIVYASPACEPMGGRSASEYIGQRMHAWIHPDDLSASAGHWAELIARPGGVSLGRARFRRADGSWRYVESTNTNLLDDPDVRGVVANFRDVTERVEAEEQRRQIADELAHASSLLHAVANHTTDAIFVKDRAGKYLLFNQAAARFVGRPVEAVLGRDDAALFDADSARLVMERDRQIMDSGELLSAEEELTAAGATRVYHATKSPYRDAHGNVIGLIGISRDITERKRFEEALQASEERYRAVVEDQTETVCRVRADGSFIFANQAFCRLVGKSPGEVATLRGSDVAHPDDLARVQAALATLSPANPIVRVENRLRDSKGESRWLEFVNQGFFDPAGKLVELQAIGRDITERRRAEEALRASEERYRTLLHCIPDPLFVYDEETLSYLAANDAAVNTYGYSREELLGMTILDLRPPEDIPCLLAMLERSPGGLEARGAWRHRKKDGSLIYVDITAHHILVDGRRACIVLARDITGRREAEEALRTSEERLRLAMDATGLGTYDWDLTSGTLRWDARARAILGVGPEETPSLDLHYGRLHPDDRPRIAAARQAALAPQGDGAFRTEYRVMQPNGAVRWVASEGRVAFEGAGADRRPVRFIGTLLDVTESKRAGAALRESEERFRAFMDNCPAAAFVKDDAGRLLYVNAAWRRQFDPAPADWLGRSEADFWPSEVAAAFRESDQRCLVHGPQQLEESGRLPSTGEWRSWLVLKFPLGAEGARRVGGMAWDITDRKRAEQALQESEERFRQLADAMPQIVWAARPDGFHKYFNSQWYAYTGLSRSRAHGHGWDAALHPEDRTLTRQKWRHSLATGEPYEIECRFRRHDGEYRWFLVRALPQPAANGAVARWFGTCTDIHDFKNAEVLLRDKEAKLAEAVRIAQMGYWARDLTTGMIEWSDELYEIFGVERPPAGQTLSWLLDLLHPDDRDRVRAKVAEAEAALASFDHTYRVRGQKGERVIHEVGRVFPGPDGRPCRVAGTAQDVTERTLAEELLHLRDRAMRAVTQGIVITDPSQPDNPIVYASPGFEQVTGHPADEVLGRSMRFLQGEDTDPEAVTQLRAAIGLGEPCTVEFLNYRKDGTSFWNELSISPVRDDAGRLTHFVGVSNDVTARHQLQAQLMQSQKMEGIGRLAGGIAHDFNNMLAVINGYSELILTSLPPGSPLRGYVEEVGKAGDRAAGLTRQLLAFSRRQLVEPKVLDLNQVLLNLGKMLRRLIGEDIELVSVGAPGALCVKADSAQLEQVIVNLAVNARDAMPTGGTLTIRTSSVHLDAASIPADVPAAPGSYVRLCVQDTGSGISPDILPHIFEPFFTTKGIGQGTGLGLSTVYGIVRQSGGFIHVEPASDEGTVFSVYLPCVETGVPPQGNLDATAFPRGTETILVVEDEPIVRALMTQVLRRSGYTVLEALQADEALSIIERHPGPVDLLLTDVVMPHKSGPVLAAEVRLARPEILVLFVSGYTDDSVIRHGLLAQEVELLQKPFGMRELAERVRRVLDTRVEARRLG